MYIKCVSIIAFLQIGGNEQLKENKGMQQQTRSKFFMNINREEDIDEYTFNMWKSELQRELPSFWDSMSRR